MTLLCFYCCLLAVYNLQPLCISAYLAYIGLASSNLYNCNKAQHTPSIQLFFHKKPLCHPWKIAPSHVTMMEQCDISSRPDKNQCLLEEGPGTHHFTKCLYLKGTSDPGGYRGPPTFSKWLKTVFWPFWQFTIFSRFSLPRPF
jgi:hypothetical protein